MNDNENYYDLAIKNLGDIILSLHESREYSYGRFVIRIINYLKHGKIFSLFKYLNKFRRARKVDKKITTPTEKKDRKGPVALPATGDYSVTVYTCVLKGYDTLYPPVFMPENYRYVVITDNNDKVTGWNTVNVPDDIKHYSSTEINRYVKTHPERFCKSDYAIYLDGNILQLLPLDYYISKISKTSGLAMFSHPQRNCLYKEAEICLGFKKGNIQAIDETIREYKKEGMPPNYGLNEGGVIASDLKNPKTTQILNEWWNEVVRNKTNRDQISLPYVIWKSGLMMKDIGLIGTNLRDDTRIILLKHNAI